MTKKVLVVDKKSMLKTKILNAYFAYELDAWPRNLLNRFILKYFLFGTTNKVNTSDKAKRVYSSHGTAFAGKGSWSFVNGIARNVLIFGVDNSSWSHSDKSTSNFLMLGEGLASDINGSFGFSNYKNLLNFTLQWW